MPGNFWTAVVVRGDIIATGQHHGDIIVDVIGDMIGRHDETSTW